MKRAVILICLVSAAMPSWGQRIEISWWSDYNELTNRFGAEIGKNQATVLTFVSTDTTVNAWSAVSGNKITLENAYADDQFFMAKGNSLDDGYYDTDFMIEEDTTHVNKYVYAIILDYPYADFLALGSTDAQRLANVPKDGSKYAGITTIGTIGETVTALADATPPNPPQSFRGGPVQTSLQVIPEPSSLVLIFGAAGVVGLWRRLRRR